jgi:hypothetical protein
MGRKGSPHYERPLELRNTPTEIRALSSIVEKCPQVQENPPGAP